MSHLTSPDTLIYRPTPALEALWREAGFRPNPAQEAAIRHVDGPLYLPAGPGSGKTRVLLWRALNLIVYHDVLPADIFLSTFTEKAALQLREGLQRSLAYVSNITRQQFDLNPMYVGTVHSLCQRILSDRRFSAGRQRMRPPRLMDELEQYFYLYRSSRWAHLLQEAGIDTEGATALLQELFQSHSQSRHHLVNNSRGFFNRLSEECIDPITALHLLAEDGIDAYLDSHGITSDGLTAIIKLYESYRRSLDQNSTTPVTDFSLLQQSAYDIIRDNPEASSVFKHVIIDEYQDTNTIQERIFFALAAGHSNICVVGDDDQALYRFRGATVENFVQFPQRCRQSLGIMPHEIPLVVNYRSRSSIVKLYSSFIENCDWKNHDNGGHYRVLSKRIQPHRIDHEPAVVATAPAKPEVAFAEIAELTRQLIESGKVADPNQIAFLFPSLQYRGSMNTQVRRMKDALEAQGLRVYAPRAGRFLEVDEAVAMFGLFAHILGAPERGDFSGADFNAFHDWLARAKVIGHELMENDEKIARFVADRQSDITKIDVDYRALLAVVESNGWTLDVTYDPDSMRSKLESAAGLSTKARATLGSTSFDRFARRRSSEGTPFTLSYVINRATSLDWSLLDLFYRLSGFQHFRSMIDLAENGVDEGPICNLGLVTQYIGRFMDEYFPIITADRIQDNYLQRLFFSQYLYALFRLGESEFENKEDIFPRGRIPFLTIHQAKGLEFPVVVLANPRRDSKEPQRNEVLVRPFLERTDSEPLDRSPIFDGMRMFYVALSRAENLLILGHLHGQSQRIYEQLRPFFDDITRIADFNLDKVPSATLDSHDKVRTYSYTADFLTYRKCPRNYMVFRYYGFQPSRSQTMFFGTLVHRTLEDLHNHLIARKNSNNVEQMSTEAFIDAAFEDNYEALRADEGRGITPDVKETARQQVQLYWQKMHSVAECITDTEVKLCLPNQRTPKGLTYSIEGVVDIVRDDEKTVMYDIKTHDGDYVRANREVYADQLNVYAHIWHELRGQPLDGCAIIATDYPASVKRALALEDDEALGQALSEWDPLVPVSHNVEQVQQTVLDFGQVVDEIENKAFQPPPLSVLKRRLHDKETFATRVCRNCDARFSCASYEAFAFSPDGPRNEQYFNLYFDDAIQEGWRVAGLNAMPRIDIAE